MINFFNIPLKKLTGIVTDNGANFVKACREYSAETETDQHSEDEENYPTAEDEDAASFEFSAIVPYNEEHAVDIPVSKLPPHQRDRKSVV